MRKKLLIMTLALVALLGLTTLWASAASATNTITLYVDASATTDQSTLTFQTFQEAWAYAIDTNVPTDTAVEIVLQSDTTMTTACTVTRNITIKSEGGPYTVTNSAVFTVNSGGTLTLENVNLTSNTTRALNVTNGHLYLNDGATLTRNRVSVSGANASFTMNGGTITGNSAGTTGGGVYVSGGTFTMTGGSITSNTGTTGGGVYVDTGTFTMSGGTIGSNTGTIGGGVYMNSGTFTMSGGTIGSNTATAASGGGGGGVAVSAATFTMSGGEIRDNNGAGYGGGVRIGFGNGSPVFTMTGGSIINNKQTGSATNSGGGGVFVRNGTFNMSGTPVIKGNTAAGTGNNLHFYYLATTKTVTLTGPLTDGAWVDMADAAVGSVLATGTEDDVKASAEYFRDEKHTCYAEPNGTRLIWRTATIIILENGSFYGGYGTLNAAIAAYSNLDTQVIQLTQHVTNASTVDKTIYLDLNGYNITGNLTINNGYTLHGLDGATDAYTSTAYGRITSVVSGKENIAQYTDTGTAHTTKAKHYLMVEEANGISFHRYNMQVSDYYFRLKYNENDTADKGTIDLNFRAAVQGNSKVADAITSLELSSTPNGGTETKTSVLTSDLATLKATLNAGTPYYHRSHFIIASTNPYTEQYALKVSLGFGQAVTASATKNRTLRDILGYFIKEATQEQKDIINGFLTRNGLPTFP